MLNSFSKLTMFDVHSFNSESTLLFLELVREGLLQANTLKVKKRNKAFILTTIAHNMVAVVA